MKGDVEQSKLQIRLEYVRVPSYLRLIEETEQIHSNILKTLQNIQIKDIQDLFYILKPTQQLYNCACGLLCFVAGVDKSITTDYLFLQQRDWVTSQSQFCKSYESINAILFNLQQNLIKKKINISNIKEAQKYYKEELKVQVNSVQDKLERILTLSINYYTSFYKIIKLNQKYEQQSKTPQEKSSDELKSYMLSKLNNNFQDDDDSEDKVEEETQIQNELVQQIPPTPKDQPTPFKMLSRFKDFKSYQKGITDNQQTSKSPKLPTYSTTSKKQYYQSKSPLQSYNKHQEANYPTNEYMSFQDHVSVKSFQTQPQEQFNSPKNNQSNNKSVQQKSSQSKSPIITVKQKVTQKKNITQLPETPNLNKIVEKIQSNDPNIEKQLKQELEMIQKQIKKLEATKKQLEWQDQRQSKKIREQYEQQYLSEQLEQSKLFLENRQKFKEEQKEEQKAEQKNEFKKQIKIQNEVQNFQQQRVWSMFKELERSIIQKEALQKDAQQMEQQVCIKNQGIQKY